MTLRGVRWSAFLGSMPRDLTSDGAEEPPYISRPQNCRLVLRLSGVTYTPLGWSWGRPTMRAIRLGRQAMTSAARECGKGLWPPCSDQPGARPQRRKEDFPGPWTSDTALSRQHPRMCEVHRVRGGMRGARGEGRKALHVI